MTSPRVTVDPWDPAYGTPLGDAVMEESSARVTIDFELPADQWTPLTPPASTWVPAEVLLVDGIRRVDARVWFMAGGEPAPDLGLAASFAAGVVRIDGRAQLAEAEVRRAIFTACPTAEEIRATLAFYPIVHSAGADPEALSLALQQRMRELELVVAHSTRSGDDDLLLLDGPLHGRTTLPRTVGYIKTHHATYLPAEVSAIVASLRSGQRTPVFTIGTTWSRHTWYVKLPVTSDMSWAGVVRCECADTLPRVEAIRLADATTALLPQLASLAHKDPRAPQNLTPIGGLEKLLRHRLGNPTKLHRSLVVATKGEH